MQQQDTPVVDEFDGFVEVLDGHYREDGAKQLSKPWISS